MAQNPAREDAFMCNMQVLSVLNNMPCSLKKNRYPCALQRFGIFRRRVSWSAHHGRLIHVMLDADFTTIHVCRSIGWRSVKLQAHGTISTLCTRPLRCAASNSPVSAAEISCRPDSHSECMLLTHQWCVQPITPFALSAYLDSLKAEGYTILLVRNGPPVCSAYLASDHGGPSVPGHQRCLHTL